VSCWLIRLLILGSGYNTMISHLGLIRTFLKQFKVTCLSVTSLKQGGNTTAPEKLITPFCWSLFA
ncbi:hypothetical protein, partial [Providencia huaxiensis]